jgi:hypothetical protein
LIYEPFGLVHQWGNPGAVPLTFLAFNINPEVWPLSFLVRPRKVGSAGAREIESRICSAFHRIGAKQ